MNSHRWLRAIAIVFAAVLFASPLAFMLLGSLRMPGLPPPDGFEVLPQVIRWANYQTAFGLVPLWTEIKNSLFVVAFAVPITVLVGSWAGYAIVAAEARQRKRLILFSIVALMIPVSALWVPRFVMFRWTGLIDTPWPLIAPALMATTPFYVLIFALGYSRIPRQLFEAARLEGLSELGVWRRVAWPLGKPAAFAVAVLAFAFHWSNFTEALLYLYSEERFTLPLGLKALQSLEPALQSLFLAAAFVATLPVAVAFLAAHRAFFTKTLEVK